LVSPRSMGAGSDGETNSGQTSAAAPTRESSRVARYSLHRATGLPDRGSLPPIPDRDSSTACGIRRNSSHRRQSLSHPTRIGRNGTPQRPRSNNGDGKHLLAGTLRCAGHAKMRMIRDSIPIQSLKNRPIGPRFTCTSRTDHSLRADRTKTIPDGTGNPDNQFPDRSRAPMDDKTEVLVHCEGGRGTDRGARSIFRTRVDLQANRVAKMKLVEKQLEPWSNSSDGPSWIGTRRESRQTQRNHASRGACLNWTLPKQNSANHGTGGPESIRFTSSRHGQSSRL